VVLGSIPAVDAKKKSFISDRLNVLSVSSISPRTKYVFDSINIVIEITKI
jgi:hypothetical protein